MPESEARSAFCSESTAGSRERSARAGSNSPAPVYFGYRTALQIARFAGTGLPRTHGVANALPKAAPRKPTVLAAIDLLERRYPGLRVSMPADVVVGDGPRCGYTAASRPHRCTQPLPERSFYRVASGVYCSAPPLAFLQVASVERDEMRLAQLAFELCGTYQTHLTGVESRTGVKPLSSARAIRTYALSMSGYVGSRSALNAIGLVDGSSGSACETKLALLLGLSHEKGGYGLGMPRMNARVEATRAARALTGKSHFRPDISWPGHKVDVEYQSNAHHRNEFSRKTDSRREHALDDMGWVVKNVTDDELNSLAAMDSIAEDLYKNLRKRHRNRVKYYHGLKLALRRKLGLRVGVD